MAIVHWSKEQLEIFTKASESYTPMEFKPIDPIVLIEATAGAAKSSSMVEHAFRLNQSMPGINIRYLVYGSANAAEAKKAFGSTAMVSTTHSLAYNAIVKSIICLI